MSEPRKLNTGSASDPLEADRLRARQMAGQNARRRLVHRPTDTPAAQTQAAAQETALTTQWPTRAVQPTAEQALAAQEATPAEGVGTAAPARATASSAAAPRTVHTIRRTPTTPAPAAAVRTQQPAPKAKPAVAAPAQKPLTNAQRQAMVYRANAERKYGDSVRFSYISHADRVKKGLAEDSPKPREKAPAEGEEKTVYRAPKADKAQPASGAPAPQAAKHGKNGAKAKKAPPAESGKRAKRAKAKKGRWWKILLITLLALALIFGATFAFILHALRPDGSTNATGITIDSLLNTPEEFQGQYLNVLLVGVDRSSEEDTTAGAVTDGNVNDGMTDMILWLHFDNVNGTVSMLQIPRNIMVTTDRSYASNYQINSIAKTNGTDGYNNINELAQYLYDAFKLPVDGYVSIRLESLVELVDILGGIDVYVPEAIDYTKVADGGDSYLPAGMQRLSGEQVEFFLRARETYSTGDLQRLEVQRYFYAALFARLKSMTVFDIAKMVPFALSYCETDLSASKLVSVAVSLLSVHSDKITFARVPVYMGETLLYPQNAANPNSVLVVARQETADLLNEYFRDADDQVSAEELDFCEVLDTSGITPQDSALRVMNDINAEAQDAKENNNLIDSSIAQTDEYEVISDSTSDSTESDAESDASE